MNNSVIYKESQYFRQRWLLILFLCINCFSFWYTLRYITDHALSPVKAWQTEWLICAFFLLFAGSLFCLFILKLQTRIDGRGICFRFYPFQLQWRMIEWKAVAKVYVREYNIAMEYKGRGIRKGIMGTGKSYTVRGKYGIQLHLLNHQKLLIGTQQPVRAEEALRSLHGVS